MAILLTVFNTVAPVFALAAVGYIWVKLGYEYNIEFVTRLATTVSIPCLIFAALMQTEISPAALSTLSLAAFVSYLAVFAVFTLVLRLMRLDLRTYFGPMVFGNTGNIGLPLALFAFGDEGLGYAVVVFAIMAMLSFSLGVWIVAGGGSVWKIFKEPLVGATLLGALFMVQGWQTPTVITNTLELTGQIAIPLMLITVGVALARLTVQNTVRSVFLSVAKLVITGGIALAIGGFVGLTAIPLAVLVIQLATPVPVTSYLLAQKYGADAQSVAGLVIASTLLSVFYLPVILGYFL